MAKTRRGGVDMNVQEVYVSGDVVEGDKIVYQPNCVCLSQGCWKATRWREVTCGCNGY